MEIKQMRKACFLFLTGLLLMPAGCSAADMAQICEDKVGKHIQQISDIEENEDYIQYISLAEEGKLDEEGRYNELGEYEAFTADRTLPESPKDTADRKQVHITFAANCREWNDEEVGVGHRKYIEPRWSRSSGFK